MTPSQEPAQTAATQPQNRLRLAHQARRARERQLDDVRHALMDVGVIEEGDPHSHADLADVIRQLDSELNRPRVTCHARECPCPPGCGCCPALPASQDVAHWELAAQKNGWRLYSGAENQRDAAREQLAEARATIARCQAVARDWEFMSGRTAARRELLAALNGPTEEQQ